MILDFTKEEQEWLVTDRYEWRILPGCPEEIKASLRRKLELLDQHAEYADKLETRGKGTI